MYKIFYYTCLTCFIMNILVSGGLGFIGSHFCQNILKKQNKVICIDNMDPYYNPKYKNWNLELLKNYKSFTFMKGSINNQNLLNEISKKFEIQKIVHLAAKPGVQYSINHPLDCIETNVNGTLNLLEFARKFDIDSFLFASSSSIYGKSSSIPFIESKNSDMPESPYAASKRSSELFGYTYSSLYDINFSGFRLFTVYGPRGRPDMSIYKFTEKIFENQQLPLYGDGLNKRDFTYVSDIVDGISLGLEKKLGFNIFNLGNENPITIKDLIAKLEIIIGKKANIRVLPEQLGDVPITFASTNKAKKILGYKSKISIDDGLKKFVKWFRETRL